MDELLDPREDRAAEPGQGEDEAKLRADGWQETAQAERDGDRDAGDQDPRRRALERVDQEVELDEERRGTGRQRGRHEEGGTGPATPAPIPAGKHDAEPEQGDGRDGRAAGQDRVAIARVGHAGQERRPGPEQESDAEVGEHLADRDARAEERARRGRAARDGTSRGARRLRDEGWCRDPALVGRLAEPRGELRVDQARSLECPDVDLGIEGGRIRREHVAIMARWMAPHNRRLRGRHEPPAGSRRSGGLPFGATIRRNPGHRDRGGGR